MVNLAVTCAALCESHRSTLQVNKLRTSCPPFIKLHFISFVIIKCGYLFRTECGREANQKEKILVLPFVLAYSTGHSVHAITAHCKLAIVFVLFIRRAQGACTDC